MAVAPSRFKRRAIFVDRDGTLNPDLHYLSDAGRLELYPGVGDAIRLAQVHGFSVICVTNQSGIARGLITSADVDRIHERLNVLLHRDHTEIDGFYYCPHAPEAGCACRKPGVLLFERAAHDYHLDLSASSIVGDRALDVQAGDRLGLLTALVPQRGHEAESRQDIAQAGVTPEIRAATFSSAVHRILSRG